MNELRREIIGAEAQREFALAGKAVFTIRSNKTEKEEMFKVV